MSIDVVPPLAAAARVERLANGLTVCLLEQRRAPVVSTVLFYRAGTRDEAPGQGGIAHFLEHMMFKGSPRYAAGEVDRRTQALGGSNNAFTSHDATAYYFNFARDRWHEALAMEADRMAALALDEGEVASERQVILEEIAMYEAEPWDALDTAVQAALFPGHPYGRPVLGSREELRATGRAELAAFHRHHYRPDNAVLVVAGDIGGDALAAVEESFAELPAGGYPPRPEPAAVAPPRELRRLERRHGEVPRLLLALPAPPATAPEHPALRLLLGVLVGGRASRLHRVLVDEGQLCVGVSGDLAEAVGPGVLTLAAELVPGADPRRVEEVLLAELAALAAAPPAPAELARARQVQLADWIFGHERVHQQALVLGAALALFDLEFPERQLRRLLAVGPGDLAAAARCLRPEAGGVLGWSLPAGDREGEGR